jgi:6-phosphogluconolactonase
VKGEGRRAGDGGHVGDEPALEVLADPAAVSRAAATRIADALGEAATARDRADWATTGGSTPLGIYRELGESPLRERVPWDRVHVWWGDERFVPRDHPLSNMLPFDQVLVRVAALAGLSGTGEDAIDVSARIAAGVVIPVAHIHAMPMTAAIGAGRETAWVAEEYERELREARLPASEAGFPSFDVLLVGMGRDGHVLSVFPGAPPFEDGQWVAAIPAPTHIEPHVARVSLNPAILEAARLVLVVAHGPEKAGILAEVLGDERDPGRWPIQHARRGNAVWLVDEAAAAKLER